MGYVIENLWNPMVTMRDIVRKVSGDLRNKRSQETIVGPARSAKTKPGAGDS